MVLYWYMKTCIYGGEGNCSNVARTRGLCRNHYSNYHRQVSEGVCTWEWLESEGCAVHYEKPDYEDKLDLLLEMAKNGVDNITMSQKLGMKFATLTAWKKRLRDSGVIIPSIKGRKRHIEGGQYEINMV